MIEYLLIEGINDRSQDLASLAEFAKARGLPGCRPAFVNLIPFNPTAAGDLRGFKTPLDSRIASFHAGLRERDVNALVRWSSARGRDAGGACGQLAAGADEVAGAS